MRTMTKSPLALTKQAMRIAKPALPGDSSVYSRHDFTQHQLFTILVLRRVPGNRRRVTGQLWVGRL